MRETAISEFKNHALKMIDDVYKKHEELIIKKRGKPVAKVVPFNNSRGKFKLGKLAHTKGSIGDIITPLGSDMWESLK